jgi:hypothetical protein
LERVGWTFWRCFGSDYTIDTEGVVADLVSTLERMGIQPIGNQVEQYRYTEHRLVGESIGSQEAANPSVPDGVDDSDFGPGAQLAVGDRVVIRFVDRQSQHPLSFTIVESKSDEQNGYLDINSDLAKALSRSEPDEEVMLMVEGQERRLLFVAHEPTLREAA